VLFASLSKYYPRQSLPAGGYQRIRKIASYFFTG
jgi:hypothetical protein